MGLFSWFRWTAILGVLAVIGASDSHAFQNLDFEGTFYPVDSYGVFKSPYQCSPNGVCDYIYNDFDPTIVMPGWTLSTELFDGSPVPEPYTLFGALIAPGHIGGTTEFHVTDASEAILEGNHSLSFRAGSSVDFSIISTETEVEYPLPGDGYAYPVVSQEGIIPPDTQSVVMLTDHSIDHYQPEDGSGFTVRFDGYEVEMRAVDIADFPDATSGLQGRYFAGNIEPLGFSQRLMSIRPEKGDPMDLLGELPMMLLDAISFSTFPAPGPPIQLPEPNTAVLVAILLFTASGVRSRFV